MYCVVFFFTSNEMCFLLSLKCISCLQEYYSWIACKHIVTLRKYWLQHVTQCQSVWMHGWVCCVVSVFHLFLCVWWKERDNSFVTLHTYLCLCVRNKKRVSMYPCLSVSFWQSPYVRLFLLDTKAFSSFCCWDLKISSFMALF